MRWIITFTKLVSPIWVSLLKGRGQPNEPKKASLFSAILLLRGKSCNEKERFFDPRVACKRAFDAKRRGRTENQVKNHEKIISINGGTQVWKFSFIKRIYHLYINGGTQEGKLNFIKLFYIVLSMGVHKKKF